MRRFVRVVMVGLLLITALVGVVGPVSAAESAPPPSPNLPPLFQNRWIEVDLTSLVAIAWEGDTAVYTAPVSTGRVGYLTPEGSFRILRRVANETMDSSTYGVRRGMPGYYLVKNVRYTQYITNDGVALHANYWSSPSVFGYRNDSHGCVGMSTVDAAWFWDFATVGTPVIIHHSNKAVVPAVTGLGLAEAAEKLAAAGLGVQSSEERNEAAAGQVFAQSLAGGTLAERGAVVQLTVSTGPIPPVRPPEGLQSWVPVLVGVTEDEARQRLAEAGLSVGYPNYQSEADISADALPFFQSIKPGCVLSSNPPAETPLPRGSVIQIAVRQP